MIGEKGRIQLQRKKCFWEIIEKIIQEVLHMNYFFKFIIDKNLTKIPSFCDWHRAKSKHSSSHEIFIKFTILPNWIFLSLKLQKHSSTDCFSFLVLHFQLLGHFCHLTDSKNVCLILFHELFCRCRAVLRRKEINFTALLHKSAYDYLTLTLKLLCSAMRLSLGNVRKKKFTFFLFFLRRSNATEQKIFY